MCVTTNKEQCLLALYISLDSVPFSQLLQFEGVQKVLKKTF